MSKFPFKKIIPAFIWLLIVITLLSLPGSTLPNVTWMSVIQLDKWVHIFLFSMLTVLFCFPLLHIKSNNNNYFFIYSLIATILSIAIGIIMEYVQKYFIPNRSFDIWDITADSIGALIGWIFCLYCYKKSPDRHQGRN